MLRIMSIYSPEICRVPESSSVILGSPTIRRRPFLNQRMVGGGSPEDWHCSMATLLMGSVWFWGLGG